MNFNKELFTVAFESAIIELAGAEKITKAVLLTLSRSVLEAHHETQDVGYINRLVDVLTPVNKRAAILFFTAFSGFKYSEVKAMFTSKDKKEYDAIKEASDKFLADPLNNIWTWSAREIGMEAKEFDAARLKKATEALLKKADNNGFKQIDVLKAMIASGLSIDTLTELMAHIAEPV